MPRRSPRVNPSPEGTLDFEARGRLAERRFRGQEAALDRDGVLALDLQREERGDDVGVEVRPGLRVDLGERDVDRERLARYGCTFVIES